MSQWPRIILFGDSITQYSFNGHGWGTAIASDVQRKCDIFNRGFSGYTTKAVLKYIDEVMDQELLQNVAVVTVFFGANDSTLYEENEKQHVPLDLYQNNLILIINHFLKYGVDSNKIIIISPPPVIEKKWLEHKLSVGSGTACDRDNSNTAKYANAAEMVAKMKDCRFIDLWKELMATKNLYPYLHDGLHLSQAGNDFLATLMKPHIEDLTENLPTKLPYWNDLEI